MQADKSNFQAYSKVRGLLTSASEELPDVPLYYNLHTMCKTLRVTPPGNSIVRSAIVNAGERPCRRSSSYTYCIEAFACHTRSPFDDFCMTREKLQMICGSQQALLM